MTIRPQRKLTRWLLPLLALQACLAGTAAFGAASATQFGITWTFDRSYTTGQFANGDYWVVGPVKITSISPRSTTSGGVTMHGSMVNPVVNGPQGYDSRMKSNTFSASVNVGATLPLTLQPGTSLLSSESYAAYPTSDNPQLKTIAILTVLSSPAPAGSFRPPPVGTNKTLSWNKSQLNYSKLRSLAPVASTPSLASVEGLFERPWIEQGTTWVSRYMHPGGNQPTYGREIAHTLAQGLLSLQLNYTNAQKEKLLVRMVQYGIDVYGSARLGGVWPAGGGHNHGRKMPMLLAGAVLGDANILSYTDGHKMVFQEDRQTWYVCQTDVGRALYTNDGRPRVPYIQSDVGVPEWGEKHSQEPIWDGRNWDSYYRVVVGASIEGHVLAARLMGLQEVWNWPALFDYADRYFQIESSQSSTGINEIQPFVKSMWLAYRSGTPPVYNDDNVATDVWENAPIGAQSSSFTIAFDLVPSAGDVDGITGLSNGVADAFTDLAASVRFTAAGIIDARNGSAFQALSVLRYSAGVKYRVVMSVNVPAKTYSVTVTPEGGNPVTLATNWKFRVEQAASALLNNVGFYSSKGYHAVLDIGVQPPAAAPTPDPSPVPTTPAPTSGTTTVTVNKTSSATWQNVTVPSITSKATVSFDMTPNGAPIDSATALTSGAADAYADFGVAIRLAPSGMIDCINGNSWTAASSIKYVAGKTYHVTLTIDMATHKYSATVTPDGGAAIALATNAAFRTSQAAVTQLNNLTLFSTSGQHKVATAKVQLQ